MAPAATSHAPVAAGTDGRVSWYFTTANSRSLAYSVTVATTRLGGAGTEAVPRIGVRVVSMGGLSCGGIGFDLPEIERLTQLDLEVHVVHV
jgi:hypothetical protein